jgi:hypothetical protein
MYRTLIFLGTRVDSIKSEFPRAREVHAAPRARQGLLKSSLRNRTVPLLLNGGSF